MSREADLGQGQARLDPPRRRTCPRPLPVASASAPKALLGLPGGKVIVMLIGSVANIGIVLARGTSSDQAQRTRACSAWVGLDEPSEPRGCDGTHDWPGHDRMRGPARRPQGEEFYRLAEATIGIGRLGGLRALFSFPLSTRPISRAGRQPGGASHRRKEGIECRRVPGRVRVGLT